MLSPPMEYSRGGLLLTEDFEGCKLTAYPDPATGGAPWTIGYGHTGPDVRPGLIWTHDQAVQALIRDENHAIGAVNALVCVPLTQGEFDALVDFAFNAGIGALQHSTLLRLLNAGDYHGAATQFELWDRAGGKVLAGLLRRRQAETQEFNSGAAA